MSDFQWQTGGHTQLVWRCMACGDTATEVMHFRRGDPIMLPELPHGWGTFNESVYCDKHRCRKGSAVIIELSEEELGQIEDWYISASGESATIRDETMFSLLDKIDIHATESDLYYPDPSHVIEEDRPEVEAKIQAISAYRVRHPDYEEVINAKNDDA